MRRTGSQGNYFRVATWEVDSGTRQNYSDTVWAADF